MLKILKIPRTVFFADPLFKYLKKHTYEFENTQDSFFTHPFFKYLKKHTYESENTQDSFFAHPLFKYLKKHTYKSENTLDRFLLIPFSNISKSILTNLKTPLFVLIIILKETIYIKTIIQINKHKAKYIITACIPIIIIKNFLLFIKKKITIM